MIHDPTDTRRLRLPGPICLGNEDGAASSVVRREKTKTSVNDIVPAVRLGDATVTSLLGRLPSDTICPASVRVGVGVTRRRR